MNQKTAILIFANSASAEAQSKGFKNALPLFDALNKRTYNLAKATGLPIIWSSERDQMGQNFGERFTNALYSAYRQGFDNIIAIGNDTPHLQARHLNETAERLQDNPIVLGPSLDGGFYLMGLHKALFNPKTFLKLPWQTSNLNRSIYRLIAKQNISIHYLDVLNDVDSASDIAYILQASNELHHELKRLLKHCVLRQSVSNFTLEHKTLTRVTPLFFNKGSPLALSI